METFPAFFPLKGARVVIVGDGEAAEAKARLFIGSPAVVIRLLGPEAARPEAFHGASLVFVALSDAAARSAAAEAARASGAPVNVVDHPDLSDFHTPAIIDRGQVVAAVGTAGAAPVLATLLRGEIELLIAPGAGALARLLMDRRSEILTAFPDFAERRAFFRSVLTGPAGAAADAADLAQAAARLDEAIAHPARGAGRVSFVIAPKAADLLSIRAVRALNRADIVAAETGAEPLIASHARRDAERWTAAPVDRLADHAHLGDLIVVVTADPNPGLVEDLARRGVVVERLAPAPGV